MIIKNDGYTAFLDDLTREQVIFFRKAYRTLRIRMAAYPPGYAVPGKDRHSGQYYGLGRVEAKKLISDFAREISWYEYLGSK